MYSCIHVCKHTHSMSFFLFFLFSNSCSLPVESCLGYSTYNWGGGTKAKVTVLALMCQHYSRPEIQAGSLSLYPLLPSQLLLDTLPIFLLIELRFLFCLSYTSHLGDSWEYPVGQVKCDSTSKCTN